MRSPLVHFNTNFTEYAFTYGCKNINSHYFREISTGPDLEPHYDTSRNLRRIIHFHYYCNYLSLPSLHIIIATRRNVYRELRFLAVPSILLHARVMGGGILSSSPRMRTHTFTPKTNIIVIFAVSFRVRITTSNYDVKL